MGKRLAELTLQGFLKWEEKQPDRHEFQRGEVFAMVGARRVHNEVVGNIDASLKLFDETPPGCSPSTI